MMIFINTFDKIQKVYVMDNENIITIDNVKDIVKCI